MPPTIEVSEEVLERLDESEISPYSRKLGRGLIYIPPAKLHFAKRKTLQEKNWFEVHETLSQEKLGMSPTLLELAQTLKYLRENPNTENTELYNEITQVRSPWRATWIDAYFEKRKDGLYILTGNRTEVEKLDKDTLIKDKRISLDSWIENPTSQGLPRKNVKSGDLYFRHPKDKSVAGFVVSRSDGGLDCGSDPAGRSPSIRVHIVLRD